MSQQEAKNHQSPIETMERPWSWTPVFVKCLLGEGILRNGSTRVPSIVLKTQHETLMKNTVSYAEFLRTLSIDGFIMSTDEEFVEFSPNVYQQLDTTEPGESIEEGEVVTTDCSGSPSSEYWSISAPPSSASSLTNLEEEMYLTDILDWFIKSGIISESNRVVTRDVFAAAVTVNYAKWCMNEDQLITALKYGGFIESIRQQMCTFSTKVFAGINNNGQLSLEITHRVTIRRRLDSEFGASPNYCIVCRKKFLVAMLLEQHMHEVHGHPFEIPAKVSEAGRDDKCFELQFAEDINGHLYLSARNTMRESLIMDNIFYLCSYQFVKIASKVGGIELAPNELLQFSMPRDMFSVQEEIRSMILVFRIDEEYVEHYHLKANYPNQLLGCPLFTPEKIQPDRCKTKRKNIQRLKLNRLKSAAPSKEIVNLFNNFFVLEDKPVTQLEAFVCRTIRSFIHADPKQRLNAVNYVDMFSYCVQIDDCGQERQMMAFDRVQYIEADTKGCFRLKFENRFELPPDVHEGGLISLRKIGQNADYLEGIEQQVIVKIESVEQNYLIVRPTRVSVAKKKKEKKGRIDVTALYNVRFKSNRMPTRMEHQALEIVRNHKLAPFFFPAKAPVVEGYLIERFDWFNANISNNPEQMQAVKSIVNGTAFPSPYIIFGPPGTGKTATIVETIGQLWKVVTHSRVLVTAQSNAACDEIAKRLLSILPRSHIYRFYARSFENNQERIDEDLMDISNLRTGQFELPGYSELYGYRVVIATLITVGHFVLANLDPQHFSHVFIDECASSTEVGSLIPIAGIVTAKKQIYGNIILAGDIQQLGPILRTGFATRLSYDKTLMERLMELPIYQKDPATKKFNPHLITKLVRSFRSHPKIIEFANKTFYDGDLIAKGSPESTHWAMNWRWLPKQNFPVIFEPVFGESKKDDFFFSSYNDEEILHVVRYVRKIFDNPMNRRIIEQADIGIISPYKKQCEKIAMRCRLNGWPDIEVGTVELFQGREKPIIIVSTVRSGTSNVGFLSNPKRLNVTVTRAKALMIIIGNPMTLQNDPYWYDLLKFCQDNGGCTKNIELAKRPEQSNTVLYGPAEFSYHSRLAHKNQNVYIGDFL